ncbi:MAG: hypothetical protein ACPGVE_01005 [Flavobacteriales bacterium]
MRHIALFSLVLLLLGSCSVEKEKTNASIRWHELSTQGNSNFFEVVNYESSYTKGGKTGLFKLVGRLNAQDSIVIKMAVVGTHDLLVGDYLLKPNGFYSLTYHKGNSKATAVSGRIHLFRVQNRVDFDFEVELDNGLALLQGEARNVLLQNSTPAPPPPPIEPPTPDPIPVDTTPWTSLDTGLITYLHIFQQPLVHSNAELNINNTNDTLIITAFDDYTDYLLILKIAKPFEPFIGKNLNLTDNLQDQVKIDYVYNLGSSGEDWYEFTSGWFQLVRTNNQSLSFVFTGKIIDEYLNIKTVHYGLGKNITW